MSRVYLVHGLRGTGKTTFAFSGEGRKWYAEFDPGSYERAAPRLGLKEGELDFHQYYPPLTSLEDWGQLDTASVGRSGQGGIQIAHKYTGWSEVYRQFTNEFLLAAKDPSISTLILDTGKMLWEMARTSMRQRIQEEADLDEKRRLVRLDYAEPNSQMHQLVRGAKTYNKTLVIVTHSKEEWVGGGDGRQSTGKFLPDGWNESDDISDCTLYFAVRNKRPLATIQKGGAAGMDMEDREVPLPTLPLMEQLISAAALLGSRGMDIPEDNTDLLELAASVG